MLCSRKTKNGNIIELFGNPKAKCLVVGVFHGDEPQGKFLIEQYMKKKPESNLLFIPCLNPDGLALGTRENTNRVDLNRNFNDKSEIETQFIIEIMETYKPDIVLTLHAPFRIVNFDGPAAKVSEIIADIIDYPVQEDIGYPTPGSFGTWAGVERQIPTITLELDEQVDVKELVPAMDRIFDYLSNYNI